MIILCKAKLGTLQLLINTLERYETVSGWKINKEKSALYFHSKPSSGAVVMAKVATIILRKEFPFNYLGYPVFHLRKNKAYYQHLMNKINNKLQS